MELTVSLGAIAAIGVVYLLARQIISQGLTITLKPQRDLPQNSDLRPSLPSQIPWVAQSRHSLPSKKRRLK